MFRRHDERMPLKKRKKAPANRRSASVGNKTTKPRTARPARRGRLDIGSTRIREQPSATTSGIVKEIILSTDPALTEKAQIAVDGAAYPYRDFRIENALTDEYGDEVSLEKGDHVEVTVTSEPKKSTAAKTRGSRPVRRKAGNRATHDQTREPTRF